VSQETNFGLGLPVVEVPRSHTQVHPVGLLSTSQQLIAETAANSIHNEHKKLTFKPSASFEPAVPTTKRQQICALDDTARGIG
jgi:hypothetical protein